jgi:hypothetical protein
MSTPAVAPVAPAAASPAAEPAATPPAAPAKPSGAAAALVSITAARAEAKAKREADAAAKAKPADAPGTPAAPVIPPELQTAADRWKAHEKAETARIAAEAADLDDADKALIDGEPDIARKAALLARFKRDAAASAARPPKVVATPKPAGGPPSSSAIDFAAALTDPKAMADAKARDPNGLTKFISGLLTGSPRKSSLG